MAANGTNSSPKKIFMWLNLRSLSTVFEKCVAHMDGTQIWHEPYLNCYFNLIFNDEETFKKFPAMKAFAKSFNDTEKLMEDGGHAYEGENHFPSKLFNYDWVKEQLEKPVAEGKSFMFIKDTAIGIDGNYDKLPQMVKHTFIIRHPYRVAPSVQRLLGHLVEHKGKVEDFEIGSGHPFMAWEKLSPDPLYKLWNYVRENIDPNPIVLDADDIQNHPEQMLRKYCEAVGVPFEKKYLKWDKSDEYLKTFYGSGEELIWGKKKGVYKNAFSSTCIMPLGGPVPETCPDTCIGYANEFLEGYKVMYETRMKPE